MQAYNTTKNVEREVICTNKTKEKTTRNVTDPKIVGHTTNRKRDGVKSISTVNIRTIFAAMARESGSKMWDQIERKCKLCGKVYRVDGNQNSIQDSMCPACEKFLKPLTECFVPVIRCKNCANGMVSDNNEYIICCSLGVSMGFDDYCSYGERKDNENE